MKTLLTSNGFAFCVDDDIAVWIASRAREHAAHLSSSGYVMIDGMGLHTLVYRPRLPRGWVVDHIDGDKLNCQRANLQPLLIGENVRKALGLNPIPQEEDENVHYLERTREWLVNVAMPLALGGDGRRLKRTFPTRDEAARFWRAYVRCYRRARAEALGRFCS